MTKKALITGISGQDGSYLTELLLSKGYEVHGIVRRHSVAENQDARLQKIEGEISCHYGDMLDYPSLQRAVGISKPDFVFHLAHLDLLCHLKKLIHLYQVYLDHP